MRVKHQCIQWSVLLCFSSTVGGCSSDEQKSTILQPPARSDVVAKTTLLATITDQDKPHTVDSASPDKEAFYVDFSRLGGGVVYITKVADSLQVVHNGRAGKPYQAIDNLRISPDGQRIAYVVPLDGKRSLVVDGRNSPLFDDIGSLVFSPDSRHLAYRATAGEQFRIVVDGKSSEPYRVFNNSSVFSSDSTKIAYAEGAGEKHQGRLIVSDLSFKNKTIKESCGDQLVTNPDNTRIAAVCIHQGKRRVISFSFDQPQKTFEGPLYEGISQITFAKDGTSISYVAEKEGLLYSVLNNTEKPLPQKAVVVASPVVRPDLQGAAIIMSTTVPDPKRNGPPGKPFVYRTFDGSRSNENEYDMVEDLVYNKDGSSQAYAALKKGKWRIVVKGREGSVFDRVTGPMFSPDGKSLVYRARQDGKRFVVVTDANGKIIRRHQSYELVFTPVLTADGTSVAYGVKEGKELWWKVEKLK